MFNFVPGGAFADWLNTTFAAFDWNMFSFFAELRHNFLTVIAVVFSAMGSSVYIVLFALFGLVLCFFRRTRKVGFALVFAVIIGTLLTTVLIKPYVLRERPYVAYDGVSERFMIWYSRVGSFAESDYSFPSGHTTGATEIAVVLCASCLAYRKKKGGFVKKIAWVPPLVAFFVGASRVYLMVHYASDVIAGFIIGTVAGILGYLLSLALCRVLDKMGLGRGKRRGYVPQSAKRTVQMGELVGKKKTMFVIACIVAWLVMLVVGLVYTVYF